MGVPVRYYRVRNWDKYQHYKKANPAWIKLYLSILNEENFLDLPDHSKVQLLCCFGIAAAWDNRIPDRPERIDMFNRSEQPMNLAILQEAGWLEEVTENGELFVKTAAFLAQPSGADSRESLERLGSIKSLVLEEKRREEQNVKQNLRAKPKAESQKPNEQTTKNRSVLRRKFGKSK